MRQRPNRPPRRPIPKSSILRSTADNVPADRRKTRSSTEGHVTTRKPGRAVSPPAVASREVPHVAPAGMLAEAAVEIALAVEHDVFEGARHADRCLAAR